MRTAPLATLVCAAALAAAGCPFSPKDLEGPFACTSDADCRVDAGEFCWTAPGEKWSRCAYPNADAGVLPAHCTNGRDDPDLNETGYDCGGECVPCGDADRCKADGDCLSGKCRFVLDGYFCLPGASSTCGTCDYGRCVNDECRVPTCTATTYGCMARETCDDAAHACRLECAGGKDCAEGVECTNGLCTMTAGAGCDPNLVGSMCVLADGWGVVGCVSSAPRCLAVAGP